MKTKIPIASTQSSTRCVEKSHQFEWNGVIAYDTWFARRTALVRRRPRAGRPVTVLCQGPTTKDRVIPRSPCRDSTHLDVHQTHVDPILGVPGCHNPSTVSTDTSSWLMMQCTTEDVQFVVPQNLDAHQILPYRTVADLECSLPLQPLHLSLSAFSLVNSWTIDH
ncbi:hypothetical protein BD289DRAFT_443550 [Coniella lustricola]|uniref:Uncharacterized protein n=1 Tax=Coniella lustricola TaxID=2025994 RepID=A0A2T2ZWU3_9PEZI|nr:hypothetical protein BD289DRAFT_443550 [Coniella lustricola]